MSGTDETVALVIEARRVLREELMPKLGGDARFRAAMVANVMAIAARQLQQGASLAAADAARLRAFLGATGGDPAAELCARIRTGDYDDDDDLTTMLQARTTDRLAISNPDYGDGKQ